MIRVLLHEYMKHLELKKKQGIWIFVANLFELEAHDSFYGIVW